MHYMGIDHHKQFSFITVLNEGGEVVRSRRAGNMSSELERFLTGIDEVKAVVEAGRSSYAMVDLLDKLGVEVILAHPKEVKAIAKAKIKTDKRDAYILAHLLRTDLIPEVYKRSRENRLCQRILRQRAFYVGNQTRVKNRIRALLAQQSEEVRHEISRVKNLFSREGMKVFTDLVLPEGDKELIDSLLKTYRHMDARRRETHGLVEKLYAQLPEARIIHTVPGFGVFLSVLVAVEIADISRFDDASKLHSYAGVIPSTHSSGERTYHGRIVRDGNRWLRWAAVEAVWPAIRADFDIRIHYERRKKRKGANVAKVATARRLLTIIYRMLKENRAYIPYKKG
jgi:transposase